MKKSFIILPVVAFVFALAVAPASASYRHHHRHDNGEIKVTNSNTSMISNEIYTLSNTGGNVTEGNVFDSRKRNWPNFSRRGAISTGDAYSYSEVVNTVGVNETYVEDPSDGTSLNVSNNNFAFLTNKVATGANTGLNRVYGGYIRTGAAQSQTAVINYVGSNLTEISD